MRVSEDANVRREILEKLMSGGVVIIDPNATYISADCQVGRGAVIYPGNVLENGTKIGEECVLYPNNRIDNSTIGESCKVESSLIESSEVGRNTKIGPNAHLREKTFIGKECRVGNFVETKNVKVKDGAKLSHLSYCGDGVIGERANISCGVIFSNYDGIKKHQTVVGEGAFVGCNVNLVAPVKIGDGAYIAAGSTITEDVPENALGIARNRQLVKDDWARARREKGKL